MKRSFFCALVVSLVLPCLGTEIEAKDGRKFEATILSATDKAVSVRKAGRDVTIQRDSLSVETNKAIDAFLKEKRDTNDKDLSNFEMTIGGKLRRISLWLPDRRVPLNPSTGSIQISGGSGSNHLSLAFYSGATLETAETAMNAAKKSLLASANRLPKAVAEKVGKTINVEKKDYGEWSGYVLEGWSERENSEGEASAVLIFGNKAYFVKDGFGVSFTFQLDKDGSFTRRNMDKVIESVKIETVE